MPSYGGAVRVTVYVPIWIVNKTGLPLVFKQEGANIEAAGQDEEHEVNNHSSMTIIQIGRKNC